MDDRKSKKKKPARKPVKTTIQTIEQPADQQPANIAFEQAVAETIKGPEQPKKENRGGPREGAGRPLGLTDEKAKVKNLPQYPSIPIKQGCQALFDLWSTAAKIEQLALSDDEADILSLPLTQLQEYYFPGILPEIAGTWIMLIFAVTRVVKPRIDIVNTVRKERRAARPDPNVIYHFVAAGGVTMHALDSSYPNRITAETNKVTCQTCLKILANKSEN